MPCGVRTRRPGKTCGGGGSCSAEQRNVGSPLLTRPSITCTHRPTPRRSSAPRCSGSPTGPTTTTTAGTSCGTSRGLHFLLTNPFIARSLLDFRFGHLPAARRNAAMNGYRGLQFPWAASPVHGEEVIRLSKARVIFEQHVNMVVAVAFARFCHATGDERYLREHAWPVLSGVAEWIVSRGVETSRGFEIRECLGIAEQEMPVDNHAYVNMAAAVALREAAGVARRLSFDGPERWE